MGIISVLQDAESDIIKEAYNYELPVERIAQRPIYPYDAAKLLVANTQTKEISQSTFSDICKYLNPNDLLVFNDSKVIPARLIGEIKDSGGRIEVLLVKQIDEGLWVCLGKPLKKFKSGVHFAFKNGLCAEVKERLSSQEVLLRFYMEKGELDLKSGITASGIMPVPPYIRNGLSDEKDFEDYQSVFAAVDGSIAAPTASLHFTQALLAKIKKHGVRIEKVTLHVGTASFLPLWAENEAQTNLQHPGKERYVFSTNILDAVRNTRANGGRVIAVGTTVVRALESMAETQSLDKKEHETELFIRPGYDFALIDAMITNFHQPRTTHLLLVQAFLGRDLLEQSYHFALENDFRFLSYGDGMLLL